MENILEQRFWFDGLVLDKNDYPTETPIPINSIDNQSSMFDDYNLFDCLYGANRYRDPQLSFLGGDIYPRSKGSLRL